LFESRVLRRIFGLNREEATGGWIKSHNEELHNLQASPNIITVIKSSKVRWAGHVARMREKRISYKTSVGKPENKSPIERPRRRWKDTIKMKYNERMWTRFIWFRKGTSGGLL